MNEVNNAGKAGDIREKLDQLAAKKKQGTKTQIMEAYQAYNEGKAGAMEKLMGLVRDFAYKKVYRLEIDFCDYGTAETADDWAQNICLDVMMGLQQERTPEMFYAWVNKLTFNHKMDATGYIMEHKDAHAKLTVDVADEDGGEVEEIDNPEIYGDGEKYKASRRYTRNVERIRKIKEHHSGSKSAKPAIPVKEKGVSRTIRTMHMVYTNLEGADLGICQLMSEHPNWSYARIGENLKGKLSATAVKKRVSRLRVMLQNKARAMQQGREQRLRQIDEQHRKRVVAA